MSSDGKSPTGPMEACSRLADLWWCVRRGVKLPACAAKPGAKAKPIHGVGVSHMVDDPGGGA
jgi:hypothetical protein